MQMTQRDDDDDYIKDGDDDDGKADTYDDDDSKYHKIKYKVLMTNHWRWSLRW